LILRTECLVTRVILDDERRATGVEYVAGARIYRADPAATAGAPLPAPRRVTARREVILAAGAFNTPQLLMLSGIGPADELGRHGIPVRVDLPGVGQNLQDRYEIGVVSEMDEDFALLADASFRAPAAGEKPDRAYRQWLAGKGPYVTNGVAVAVVKRSRPELPVPDLYLFGVPGHFRGYYPGYAREVVRQKNVFTWAVLKAHTENRGGSVRLRSADPRDTPEIVFRYFEEGTDAAGADLDAVAVGIDSARRIMAHAGLVTRRELLPGREVATRAQVKDFIRREAWGHHASCSCKLGPASDPLAVVDARFRVHGVTGLRVVDASVFPRIPGFFIVTSIYMISEKAADVILEDARAAGVAEPARVEAAAVAA
jgi:choline dehydrogenase